MEADARIRIFSNNIFLANFVSPITWPDISNFPKAYICERKTLSRRKLSPTKTPLALLWLPYQFPFFLSFFLLFLYGRTAASDESSSSCATFKRPGSFQTSLVSNSKRGESRSLLSRLQFQPTASGARQQRTVYPNKKHR